MQRVNWVQKLADSADLSGETLPGIPVIEIAGDNRVIVERHAGIIEYGQERICIKVRYGIVSICGCGLELTRMERDQLVITGRVDCIQLQRRCR